MGKMRRRPESRESTKRMMTHQAKTMTWVWSRRWGVRGFTPPYGTAAMQEEKWTQVRS